MGVYMVKFSIPKAVPSLNVVLRTHWRDRLREQNVWNFHVTAVWLNSGKFVFVNPVKIIYTIHLPSNRSRDLDNYIGGTKYLTDAIKRTFLTRDDSKWLKEIGVKFEEGEEGTTVDIMEV